MFREGRRSRRAVFHAESSKCVALREIRSCSDREMHRGAGEPLGWWDGRTYFLHVT